jgi:hypothetical protein
MNRVTSIILLGLIFYSICFAQQKLYGYKYSGNGDIVSDIFFIQNGFVLDSVTNTDSKITYRFEYDEKGKLKRDINFYSVLKVLIVNGRAKTIKMPGTRDYYYDQNGDVDSIGYGHMDDSLWVNDSSGYKFHYSNDGKVTSKVYYDKDTVTQFEENTYDSTGNLILDRVVNYNVDTLITIREYDSQNRLTLRKYFNSGNQTTQKSESLYFYKYDSTGNINCRLKYIENGDTLLGGYNYYLQFDERSKIVDEIFSTQLMPDSTWGQNLDIPFNYDEYGKILKMGDVVWFHYNADGNLDTLVNVHSVYCGYLGNTATLIDTYGNKIILSQCAGHNTFYYSSIVTGIKTNKITDKTFTLFQNYPNPFNPTTTISFYLPSRSLVSLTIFDILGRKIATILNSETLSAGNYSRQWNASGYSSGIYFYRLQAGTFTETKKLILLQ